ncbi:unnamed protein product [Schistosoma spindalis]|nr:unnamed protein product [Schistosoma spindale]
MGYCFLSDNLIPVYLIVTLAFKFFDCQRACGHIDLQKQRKLVFEGDSYEYSHYYYYSQITRLNQLLPDGSDRFEEFITGRTVTPKFPFKFYGIDVKKFNIYTDGSMKVYGQEQLGVISTYVQSKVQFKSEILDEGLAVRATTLIYPNGKISFYYENIPKKIREIQMKPSFLSSIQCGQRVNRDAKLTVPGKWVTSGTLVEHEVIGDCSNHILIEACEAATTSNTKCMWCEKANMCIISNDMDIHDFKVNGCQIKSLTKGGQPRNSYNSLFIIISLVEAFFLFCTFCVIFLCLNRWRN